MTKAIEVSTDIKINIKGTEHILSKEEANALYQCLKQELGLKDTFTNPPTPNWPTWPTPTWPGTGKWPLDIVYDTKTMNTETYTFNKA